MQIMKALSEDFPWHYRPARESNRKSTDKMKLAFHHSVVVNYINAHLINAMEETVGHKYV